MNTIPKLVCTLISLLLFFNISYGQLDIKYYLPSDVSYDKNIPTPKEIIGHEVGEWHVSHDKLVQYMHTLANASERIKLEVIGYTFENRPQINLIITSSANHQNLENIKKQHAQLTNPNISDQLDIKNMPAVAYIGYSIHGDEASGSNASLLVAYYLAAAQSNHIDKLLGETVVLLDPSFNPDGLNRFANYVNANKSKNNYSDPNNMELNEPWPSGRTNHYWFDMNRDWLFVQLPESRNRIKRFQEWNPNLLTDHHEMGSNNTFFFQPGIPSRNNPNTPKEVYNLTNKLALFHSNALDSIGSLYYTQESFDDYYYGKGSTYPDINGGVGILFEQASSLGHSRKTIHGTLKFSFSIRNQFVTSLSSLKGLNRMRVDFLKHQRLFYKNAFKESISQPKNVIVFGSKDLSKNYHFAEILKRHGIEVYHANSPQKVKSRNFSKDEAFIVPTSNEKYKLIKTMFETNTKFVDSLFYDVSTWSLPLSFNIDYDWKTEKNINQLLGKSYELSTRPQGKIVGGQSSYAYAFEWNKYYSPKLYYNLLKKGFILKVATEPFTSNNKSFDRGTILIPVQIQKYSPSEIKDVLKKRAEQTEMKIYALNSGLSFESFSLGSPTFLKANTPKIAMFVGQGVRAYDAGEVWHLFDQRYDIDMAMIPTNLSDKVFLDNYNTIIMVDGAYNSLSDSFAQKLKQWVQNGGKIVASQGAMKYLNNIGISKFNFLKKNTLGSGKNRKYEDMNEYNGAQRIGGAIFQTTIDYTNPIFYGYTSDYLPVFKNREDILIKSDNPYANPMVYTSNPLLSGYISEENLSQLKNTSAMGLSIFGKGKVIGFMDNLNFRAIWYGTNKAFINAVFFGNIIDKKTSR